jgi:Matrixin
VSDAFGRIDLLSVVLHELGHVLGHDHGDEEGLMGAALETGVRHTNLDPLFADETALAALF